MVLARGTVVMVVARAPDTPAAFEEGFNASLSQGYGREHPVICSTHGSGLDERAVGRVVGRVVAVT